MMLSFAWNDSTRGVKPRSKDSEAQVRRAEASLSDAR
jgi:hypothetical protein